MLIRREARRERTAETTHGGVPQTTAEAGPEAGLRLALVAVPLLVRALRA